MTDRKRVSLFALLALLGAIALLAAGCGGGSDESSATTTETTVETTVDTDTEATDTSTETTDASNANPFASGDCLELAGIGAKFAEALGASGGTQDLEATSKFLDELVSKAPDEIKDDLATLAAAWTEIADALKGVDLSGGTAPSADTIKKLQEIGTKFDTPELQQASKNLDAWTKENCSSTG